MGTSVKTKLESLMEEAVKSCFKQRGHCTVVNDVAKNTRIRIFPNGTELPDQIDGRAPVFIAIVDTDVTLNGQLSHLTPGESYGLKVWAVEEANSNSRIVVVGSTPVEGVEPGHTPFAVPNFSALKGTTKSYLSSALR